MALWPSLVVRGTDDASPASFDWCMRLEHRCGFRPSSIAHGALDLWGHDGLRLSLAGPPEDALALAGFTLRDQGAATGPARRDSGAGALALRDGNGRLAPHSPRLSVSDAHAPRTKRRRERRLWRE